MFTWGGRGDRVNAYNLVGVVRVRLYVFDRVYDCSIWTVVCVEQLLMDCLVALSVFLFDMLSVIAVQFVYR